MGSVVIRLLGSRASWVVEVLLLVWEWRMCSSACMWIWKLIDHFHSDYGTCKILSRSNKTQTTMTRCIVCSGIVHQSAQCRLQTFPSEFAELRTQNINNSYYNIALPRILSAKTIVSQHKSRKTLCPAAVISQISCHIPHRQVSLAEWLRRESQTQGLLELAGESCHHYGVGQWPTPPGIHISWGIQLPA